MRLNQISACRVNQESNHLLIGHFGYIF